MNAPVDAAIRKEALDPTRSYIVQAPAGSGKTELLTRRILTLLAIVDEPEEILAITFTRKAASEMRQRVIEVLVKAASGVEPENAYEQEGIDLALAVLSRDKERNWQLVRNPQRLNLRTIDSLATQFAHRLPVVSALGAPIGLKEDASGLYREVAERFIENNIDELKDVLLHLGNRLELARQLLANLLVTREQWKVHVYDFLDQPELMREKLESMLGDLIESRLDVLCMHLPVQLNTLPSRLRMAFDLLVTINEGDVSELKYELQLWRDMHELPRADVDDLALWQSVAEALLTTSKTWRKKVDKRIGFPAPADAKKLGVTAAELTQHKSGMTELLESLGDHPEFHEALLEVKSLPEPHYKPEQWELLSALMAQMPSLLVELQLMFAEKRAIDFTEMGARAIRALGTEDQPTDLALSMDLVLKHVLIDEFQDTSRSQFGLFQKLVAEWSPDDGRTFFAVGDPMQSIYRFRDADVALFFDAKQHGLGSVQLEPLVLSVNFRAAPDVVAWVNETFSDVFPQQWNSETGAVPYSSSNAHLNNPGSVTIHPFCNASRDSEANLVADIAARAIASDRSHRVAILVRSKSHAAEIFTSLQSRSLKYQSIDMDLVGEKLVVRDLLSLVLALRFPHDRLHWLSLLRAPGTGLLLKDMQVLMHDLERDVSVIQALRDSERIKLMSTDGQQRVERFMSVMEPAVKRAPRAALMPWVESTWLKLGGPAACQDTVDLDAAERCLAMLRALEADGRLWQQSELWAAMDKLFANPAEDIDCQIQIMTLHKAKGLEFDTVILPALDRQPRVDSTRLLNWHECTVDGQARLLLAPFEEPGLPIGRRGRLNRIVRDARARAEEQEKRRLLYVACTRAKSQLHLITPAKTLASGDLRTPSKGSLLSPIWHLAEPLCAEILDTHNLDADPTTEDLFIDTHKPGEPEIPPPPLKRVAVDWQMPELPHFNWPEEQSNTEDDPGPVEFLWAGSTARDIGTVLHLQLQRLTFGTTTNSGAVSSEPVIELQLRNMGVPNAELGEAKAKVMLGIENTLGDPRGQWILDTHKEARSEWAITAAANVGVQKVIIDRTFVDEDGTRWIVDFKTGDHRGGQVDAFLDQEEERYRDQLDRYADIIRRIDNRPVRVGLYFPLLKGWREWAPAEQENG